MSYVCGVYLNPRFGLTFIAASDFYTPFDRCSLYLEVVSPSSFFFFLQLSILWINECTENYFSFPETPKTNLQIYIVHEGS